MQALFVDYGARYRQISLSFFVSFPQQAGAARFAGENSASALAGETAAIDRFLAADHQIEPACNGLRFGQ